MSTSSTSNKTNYTDPLIGNIDDAVHPWILDRVHTFLSGNILISGSRMQKIEEYCQCYGTATKLEEDTLADDQLINSWPEFQTSFDAIIFLAIYKYISKNQQPVLWNCNKLLKKGGYLISIIPANTGIYKELKQGLRYWDERNLINSKKVLSPYFKITKCRYFMTSNSISNDTGTLISNLETAQNKFRENIPLFPINVSDADYLFNGLSILVIGQKKDNY